MESATTTNDAGAELRAAREEAGLSRTQLARLARCSLASLAAIEQGAVPRQSRVLEQALAAVEEVRGRE